MIHRDDIIFQRSLLQPLTLQARIEDPIHRSQIYQEFGVPYILKWSLLQLFECNALRPDRIAYVYPLVTLLCVGMMTDSCLHQMCDWTRFETGLVE